MALVKETTKKVDFVPLGKRLVVKRIDEGENVTKSGLVIPKENEPVAVCEVLAVSEEVKLDIVVGDKVILTSYAGTVYKTPTQETYLIVREDDVVGVFRTQVLNKEQQKELWC